MGVASFLTSWQFVAVFYALVILLVYVFRSKFEIQAKFIALYKTKLGLKTMKSIATKHRKLVSWLGYIGIIVGYLGMAVIVFFILQGIYNLLFVPKAPPTMGLVIPGVKIPGSPVFVPFWYGLISLFLVIVIHEFSHGVVSKAHKIPVNSSGFVLFGPIPGAFVEPDEKKLKKQNWKVQNSIFAAGPFSNVLSALLVLLIFFAVLNPVANNVFQPEGIAFPTIEEGYPAAEAGLQTDVVYNKVNNETITTTTGFINALKDLAPGETVWIGNDNQIHEVIAAESPEKPEKGYIGVNIITKFTNENLFAFKALRVLVQFLNWFFLLSLGLGLANLLPLGPVDGGRMFQTACHKFFGKKKGNIVWMKTSMICFVCIILLVFVPMLKAIF